MNNTTIEWTGVTWNPMRGCTKVGPECKHCYAATIAERFKGKPGSPYERGFEFQLVPERLVDPLNLSRPKMVFVNSMSDCFHPDAPVEYLQKIAWVLHNADWHIYQILTKRADRMSKVLRNELKSAAQSEHVWWGVSVGNKRHGIPRIAQLQNSGARVKWLSVEPLLEDLGELDLTGINWVVVGGESGKQAREMKPEWVDNIREQCEAAAVPFFFKQWGGKDKKATGRLLHGRTYDQMPPIIHGPVASVRERKERLNIVLGWINEMNLQRSLEAINLA